MVRPGARVTADAVLVELSNPDVQLEYLDAERNLKLAEADLASLRASLENARLAQASALAVARTELRESERAVTVADSTLARRPVLGHGPGTGPRPPGRSAGAPRAGEAAAGGGRGIGAGADRAAARRRRARRRDVVVLRDDRAELRDSVQRLRERLRELERLEAEGWR